MSPPDYLNICILALLVIFAMLCTTPREWL